MFKVIGIGSPFGDDQVGLLLIDELRQSEQLHSYLNGELELLAVDRPGASLLSLFEGAERVIIIDAVVSGAGLGQLHRWSDSTALEASDSFLSSHGFGLTQALTLGRQLAMLPEQLLVLGVEIDPVATGADLSPLLGQQLPILIDLVVEEILPLLKPS